jgi:hypothetical protein
MLRKTLNASRLQEQVKRRIERLQEVVEDGVKIGVPRPERQPADRTGCNWTMRNFGNAAGFEASIARVLEQVQAEYNLATEAGEETEAERGAAADDPFGGTRAAAPGNPFGEGGPAPKANPFGEAKSAGAGTKRDPFGASDAPSSPQESADGPPPRKRPANPFGDD